MKTLVIILAQGQQTRLPDLPVAKQLLRLPACGNAPILYRTCHQLWHLFTQTPDAHEVRLVTWFNVYEALVREPGFPIATTLTVLENPGNSSLKGLKATLQGFVGAWSEGFERIVVLLGDTVYSWACLRAIFDEAPSMRFVGTTDLARDTGELWGMAWKRDMYSTMYGYIVRALEKHPAFTAYQPGQLRRVLWEAHAAGGLTADWLRVNIDDYTRDIDVPEHVAMIPQLSRSAREDDLANGLAWRDI